MPSKYIPALKYHILSRYYDPIMRLTCREKTFKNALIEQSTLRPRNRILDLGCGTGTLTAWVKERTPDALVFGLDPDKALLAAARKKFEEKELVIETRAGYAQSIPFEDGYFDVVISSFLFHHLHTMEKREAFKEIMRVLRSGGEFQLADWDRPHNPLMWIAFFFVRVFDGFENTRVNARGRIMEFIDAAGFQGVRRTHRYMTIFGTLSLWTAKKGP